MGVGVFAHFWQPLHGLGAGEDGRAEGHGVPGSALRGSYLFPSLASACLTYSASPAPPSAPSPSMTARWRARWTMCSTPALAAPQQPAAASPAGGPMMWTQVRAPGPCPAKNTWGDGQRARGAGATPALYGTPTRVLALRERVSEQGSSGLRDEGAWAEEAAQACRHSEQSWPLTEQPSAQRALQRSACARV